jgi:hypothetical protein
VFLQCVTQTHRGVRAVLSVGKDETVCSFSVGHSHTGESGQCCLYKSRRLCVSSVSGTDTPESPSSVVCREGGDCVFLQCGTQTDRGVRAVLSVGKDETVCSFSVGHRQTGESEQCCL